MHRFAALLPRSLVGRVFTLYAVVLLLFVSSGLGLFVHYRYAQELDETQQRSDLLLQVATPTIADSAVIGDYDTIRRTLERAVQSPDFETAVFIDLHGTQLKAAAATRPRSMPPRWLQRMIEQRMVDTNLPISVGGRDYGVMRLTFAHQRIAATLWEQALYALAFAAGGLAGGLVLLRVPLGVWLHDLGRIRSFEETMRTGAQPGEIFGEHAPIEFKQTFDVLSRTAASLRTELAERERAMTALRSVLEGLMPQAAAEGGSGAADDLAAVSQLISHLVTRLQERGAQLNAIFELSPDGFVSFDAQRRVNYMSPAFARLTGLAEPQVMGASESQFGHLLAAHCVSGQALLQDFERLRRSQPADEGHHRRLLVELARPTRRVLEVALRQSPSGGISQVLHLRDVTHETEVEQMKSEFLSTAAHELRTPMASIFGFSELMMSRRLTAERQQDVIQTIHRQTELMISIVNELLDLARIEARRGKDFALEDIDLRTLTTQVLHDFKPPHERELPALDLPAMPVPVRVDRGKMAQALGNVLSNAYKYSPAGGAVMVRLLLHDDGAQVGLEVRDCGIGMSADQLARVCERFYRADSSGSIPGTGLGMAIVKEIVELLGGSLALASTPGEGTTVTLWLPLALPGTVPAGEPALPAELAPA